MNPRRRLTLWMGLTLVVAVAAMLRLSSLAIMEYKSDEDVMVQMVSQVADEGVFIIKAERSSRGPKNSPLPAYLLAPVWAASANPVVIAWVIALMNVAAVGVTYWIGQRFLSPRAGLIAAACFAVSPWAIMFSRKIWRPDMMPLFQALLIAATLTLVVEGRKRAIFWVCLFAGLLAQFYFTGYMAIGAVLLLFIIYRPKMSHRALILGLVVLGVLYLPYGIFLVGGGWRELIQLRMDKAASWLHQVDWMWRVVNLGNFSYTIGETSYYLDAMLGAMGFLLYPFAAIERWAFIGGLGWLAWRALFPSKEYYKMRPVGLLLVFMIALPTFVCLVTPWQCWPRYFTVSYPAQFLVIGVVVDYGLVRLRSAAGSTIKYRIATSLAGLVLGGALLTQVYFTTTLFSLLKSSGGASGEYAVAYRHKVSLADHLAKTYGPGCFSLNHEWRPLYKMRMGREIESLVRRQEPEGLCRTPEPVKLYLLETIDRPLSPEAEAGLRPYERFGPVVVYKRAVSNEH